MLSAALEKFRKIQRTAPEKKRGYFSEVIGRDLQLCLKKHSITRVLLLILRIFSEYVFYKTPQNDYFWIMVIEFSFGDKRSHYVKNS